MKELLEKTFFRFSSFASLRLCVFALIVLSAFFSIQAQSTNQSFPTPVTTNEINGKIPARDIGDARLTNYFYVFNGNQGDVFINVVTKNFDGDIDVFTLNGLRPLTKITVYSDSSDNETGRIVYLRQPEKLLLRIEGRSPNDDPATFRIKFAGSFEPLKNIAENEEQEMPEIKTDEGEVRVNSVGTIIEKKPVPTPQVKEKAVEKEDKKSETVAEKKEETKDEKPDKTEPVAEKKDEEKQVAEQKKEEKEEKKEESKKEKETAKKSKTPKPVVVITDTLPKAEEKKAEKKEDETAAKTEAEKKKTEKKPKKPDPLENIKLIVLFKDGTKIERPISEVVRVSVDKGILTVITKDGLISRYSLLDVEEMTIK
jgi:hypothetical protein